VWYRGRLGYQLPGAVPQGSGHAVLSEDAFEGGERGLCYPPSAVAFAKKIFKNRRTCVYRKTVHIQTNISELQKKAAQKLQNPRLRRITFHTIRHWKATMEYSRTKDILHVQQLLGHRDIKTTMIYTHLVQFEGDEFHSATAETVAEAEKLIAAGFEYVCNYNDVMIFRKRK